MKLFCSLIIILYLFGSISSTLGPNDKKKKVKVPKEEPKLEPEPEYENGIAPDTDSFNQDAKLVKKNIIANDIIKNHGLYCKSCVGDKKFNGQVLGYVTPWNSKGYEVSKTFANKFNMISPVWLQIKRIKVKKYEFSGAHDIDKNWLKSVKKSSNQTVSFLPRILFENLKAEDLHALFNNEEEIEGLVKMLLKKCNEFNFDGYVLEIYSQLGGHGKPQINHLVTDIASGLHSVNRKLILVIPPPVNDKKKQSNILFDKQDFYNLQDVVDGFSLMTYDFASNHGIIGPNAPVSWIEKNVMYLTDSMNYRSKILLGLNFYGMKYVLNREGKPVAQPEPIMGTQLVDFLKKTKTEIKFDDQSNEHIFISLSDNPKVVIFYPSLYSIQQRIDLATELGTGISIWELGQGLDYFYDLL